VTGRQILEAVSGYVFETTYRILIRVSDGIGLVKEILYYETIPNIG
jgi:hypothetical protein